MKGLVIGSLKIRDGGTAKFEGINSVGKVKAEKGADMSFSEGTSIGSMDNIKKTKPGSRMISNVRVAKPWWIAEAEAEAEAAIKPVAAVVKTIKAPTPAAKTNIAK